MILLLKNKKRLKLKNNDYIYLIIFIHNYNI